MAALIATAYRISTMLAKYRHVLWATFILAVLLGALCGCMPVRVINDPARPVPVAPLGRSAPQADGSMVHNQQLRAEAPQLIDYEQPASMPWGSMLSQAASGNWLGLAGTALAGLATAYGVRQRQQRQREAARLRRQRDRLATTDPTRAREELERLRDTEETTT
jgi:hypothetical protein